jgi:hypothetical protein
MLKLLSRSCGYRASRCALLRAVCAACCVRQLLRACWRWCWGLGTGDCRRPQAQATWLVASLGRLAASAGTGSGGARGCYYRLLRFAIAISSSCCAPVYVSSAHLLLLASNFPSRLSLGLCGMRGVGGGVMPYFGGSVVLSCVHSARSAIPSSQQLLSCHPSPTSHQPPAALSHRAG